MSGVEAKERGVLAGREDAVSDVLFLTSRGGSGYDRTFREAWWRPGADPQNWVGRSNVASLGVVPMPDGRIGVYHQRHYATASSHLRLLTLRADTLCRSGGGG